MAAALYNSRLLSIEFSVSNAVSKHYDYNADGRLRYSRDLADDRFDRSYSYDHVGRNTEAFSGPLARGQADSSDRPYKLYYSYDTQDHLTSRSGRMWNIPHTANVGSGTYLNGRNSAWQYDADGRLTNSTKTEYTYDAAGREVSVVSAGGQVTQTQTFDGDGARAKLSTQTPTETETQYYLKSSVLNQVITELSIAGQKTRTFVYQGNEVLAWQQKFGTMETMAWEHRDLSNASVRMVGAADGSEAAELEPMGNNVGLSAPPPPSGHEQYPIEYEPTYPGFGNVLSDQCRIDGISAPCDTAVRYLGSGAGGLDPETSRAGPGGTINLPGVGQAIWVPDPRPDGGGIDLRGTEDSSVTIIDNWTGHFAFTRGGQTPGSTLSVHEPQNSETQTVYSGPCPPTKEKLAANSTVKETLDEAMKRSEARRVEHGGWIYWNKKSSKIATLIKEPTIAPLNPDITDTYLRVFLNNPPGAPKGWEIVGDFHTHPENVSEDPQDIAVNDSHKIPGMVRMPDGKISPYGNYDRGVWNRDLPQHCK
jgi:YD repeat-containing protein